MAEASPVLFLDQLRDSQLLEPAQLEELSRLPEAGNVDPRPLAKRVYQRGWLTRFQINQVVQGKARDLFIGSYVLLDRIGEGGMGQVYKARHQHMNRVVALKVIRKERLSNPAAVRRFYQEVQAAAHLNHPNIVLAFDAGMIGPTHFFAMEYVDGVDLDQLVKETGPLPVAQACDYIRQAALGLAHAHERGLIHRDIKPHNLLVTRPARSNEGTGNNTGAAAAAVVKILDMGLARLQGPAETENGVTREGAILGTPDYLAPEQAANSRAADIRSDLYSLGCTFYHLLTGHAPFRGSTLTEVLLQHQMNPAPPVEVERPEVPAAVAKIVARLMAKKPEDRFQTPAELAEALAPFCQGALLNAVPVAAPAAGPDNQDFTWNALTGGEAAPCPAGGGSTPPGDETSETMPAGDLAAARMKRLQAQSDASKRRRLILFGAVLHIVALILLAIWLWPKGTTAQPDEKEPPAITEAPKPVPPTRPQPMPAPPQPPAADPVVNPEPEPGALVAQTNAEVRRFSGHTGPVRCIVFSPDGRRFLSCGDEPGALRLWDVASGAEILQFKGLTASVIRAAFSPDGKLAVSAGSDRRLRLWDVDTGNELPRFPLPDATSNGSVAFASGGRLVLSANGNHVQTWETNTGKPAQRLLGHQGSVTCLAVSADGRFVVTGGTDKSVRIWNVGTASQLQRLDGHTSPIISVAYSRDGLYVLSGGSDRTIRLWNVQTGKQLQSFSASPGRVSSVAFSPDGRHVAAGGTDKVIHLWDQGSGKELHRFIGHTAEVFSVCFTPDGRHILSAGADGTIRLWEVPGAAAIVSKPVEPRPAPPQPPPKLPIPGDAKQAEAEKLIKELFKDDYVKKTPADRLSLSNKLTKKARETSDDPAARFVLFREGQDLAAQAGDAGSALKIIDEMVQAYLFNPFDMKLSALDKVAALATALPAARSVVDQYLTLADESIALDDYDSAVRLLTPAGAVARKINNMPLVNRVDTRIKAVRELQTKYATIKDLAIKLKTKPDDPEANLAVGKFACFDKGDWDKGLPMLAKGSDVRLKTLAQKELGQPPDGMAQVEVADAWNDLAKGEQGNVKLQIQRRAYHWYEQALPTLQGLTQAAVEKKIKELQAQPGVKPAQAPGLARKFDGHTGEVRSVALSRDGFKAVSGGNDRVVRVWDVAAGKELRRFEGLSGEVVSVAISPDGNSVAAGCADGRVHIWDANTGRELRNPPSSQGTVDTLAFSSDASSIVYGGSDRFFHLWPLDNTGRGSIGYRGNWSAAITCMLVSPNNRVALFGTAEGIWLYEIDVVGRNSRFLGNLSPVASIALSPNTLFALSGHLDGTLRLWEIATGKPTRAPFKGHGQRVLNVTFLSDGLHALSVGADKAVCLWDLKSGSSRVVLRLDDHSGELTSAAISADGRQVLTGTTDRSVRLWRLPK
jgi:serine/threonine-protein kinase